MEKLTKKAFVEVLNRMYPIANRKHKNNQYGNRKADYGTYVYNNDKGMFEALYTEWLSDPIKFEKNR